MEIQCDENGKVIDALAARNGEIIQKLEDSFQSILKEKRKNDDKIKPQNVRFGYRFEVQLNRILRQYRMMSADEVSRIDYDTIENNFYKYLDLIAYYNEYLEMPVFKQDFCAFMRINERIYSKLERSDDEDIRNLMQSINDTWIGLGFAGGEVGGMDSKAIMSRLKIKDSGQNLVENAYEGTLTVRAGQDVSPRELDSKLQRVLIGIMPKQN